MKKHTYSLIGLGIFLGPVALSFDTKVFFIGNWWPILISVLIVSALYIIWDSLVVKRGDWEFTTEWTGTWRLARLPAGEWAFFLAVPYAILFMLEVFGIYFGRDGVWDAPRSLPFILSGVFFILAYVFRTKGYTVLAMLSSAVFFLFQGLFFPDFWERRDLLLVIAASFGVFTLVDGIYTRLPTIHYNPKAIWGIRVGTIPLEDFFYNLGMIGLYVLVYSLVKSGPQAWV